ncbi:MAG TPA: sorbosone dehydrogenase family protein [Terriglobia bacterium]|nr:sorbosone dehydrogenase family protein [Terriglobia bacterium]
MNSWRLRPISLTMIAGMFFFISRCVGTSPPVDSSKKTVLKDASMFSDYHGQKPATSHQITPGDLPEPYTTRSVDNGPKLVPRPSDAWPLVPPGFKVGEYAMNLENPRLIRTAPNGDVFLAESKPGRIKVFRGIDKDGKPEKVEIFSTGFNLPFGIAFYPPGPTPKYLYVANTDSVVRFLYENGDLKPRGPQEVVVPNLPGGGHLRGGGHWTRDVAFALDGKKMYVSVGSLSNVDDSDNNPKENHRADILEANPDGSNLRVYAWGIRNAVGIAVHPRTGELWASVNERDELGDNLPPDYITHIQENGFYGWPWYYIGGNQDPRHKGKHPELKDKVIVPDVLIQPHNASLEMLFYEGGQFPEEYRGEIFAAEHGSWNKAVRTGYEVIQVPLKDGHATGEYRDFMTGFVTERGDVWGRPVGVAVAQDGSLLVSDDGTNSIWRVSYVGN